MFLLKFHFLQAMSYHIESIQTFSRQLNMCYSTSPDSRKILVSSDRVMFK